MASKTVKLLTAMEHAKSDDLDDHKSIWSFSSEHMKPDEVPPIPALIYGAKRILLPDMHWESTPDLLDVFALAELVRQQTLQDAKEALEWDEYYRKGGGEAADGVQLTDQERKKVKSIVKKASAENMREVYRTVVMQLCWAHIHFLRRSNETFRILHFFRRYFPPSTELQGREVSTQFPLWLSDLSESEFATYDATRRKLKEFLKEAEVWEQEYLKDLPDDDDVHREARMNPEYQTQFCERFSLLVKWDTLAGILLRRMSNIQTMASDLYSVFFDKDSASDFFIAAQGNSVSPILGGTRNKPAYIAVLPSSRQGDIEMSYPKEFNEPDHDGEKKESQESNASSKLSYVDTPSNVRHAPPMSLLQRLPRR